MKRIFYIAIFFTALYWSSCQKDTFNYSMYSPTENGIDSIYFSTGSKMLIADGTARLQFVVETYRKLKVTTSAGGTKDSLVFVDYNELPAGALKIIDGTGKQVGLTYSTNDVTPGTVSFYAQVGNTKSVAKMVTLRPKQVLPPKLTVDIIFHVFEMSTTDKFYDPLTYQPVTKDILNATIKDLNDVFNNRLGTSPNGASANIEFRLAATNVAGQKLAVPGLDIYTYGTAILVTQTATSYSVVDFLTYINKTPSFIWDPKKYLNLYIIPSGANNSMGAYASMYQIVPAGLQPLPGMTTPPATAYGSSPAINYPTFTTYPNGVVPNETVVPIAYESAGMGVPRTELFPGMGKRLSICGEVGSFYGLKRTQGTATYTDYCTDTRIYNNNDATKNSFSTLFKTALDGEKFLADNAMDDIRYPSLRNTFTLDQVTRIRWVIANSPRRNNGVLAP
jgi:hypothetical protein